MKEESEKVDLKLNIQMLLVAGVQPRWIQGIRSGDGVGEEQETTA